MATYTATKSNTVRFKPGIMPEVNNGLVDTLRLASIMVDPRCVELFGRMANPRQDRLALDFPELRIQAVKQKLLELLSTDFFNNTAYSPMSQPNVSQWCEGVFFDVSVPREQRNWMWLAQKLQFIKSGMSTLLSNFNKSGDLANDMDDSERDRLFFENFCNRQAMWFWIYLAWDHGRNLPAWNTSLLPDEQRLELGVDSNSVVSASASQQDDVPNSLLIFCSFSFLLP